MNAVTQQDSSYVLVTAAYNEDQFLEATIKSIIGQTLRPKRWVIVNDGSTDTTGEIIDRYAAEAGFIDHCKVTEEHPRNFAAQVNAINRGLSLLAGAAYGFVGNMDADVTMEPGYFAGLMDKFREDPGLGLAGGAICERAPDGEFRARRGNRAFSVAHACQMFRRECFESVGGKYMQLPYGGPDTYAESMARSKGWKVVTFDDLKVFHHRPTGSAGGVLKGWFRQGKMDYSLGTHPVFEIVKLLGRLSTKPYFVGACARFAGFVLSCWRRDRRAVSQEFMNHFRSEQRERLLRPFRAGQCMRG